MRERYCTSLLKTQESRNLRTVTAETEGSSLLSRGSRHTDNIPSKQERKEVNCMSLTTTIQIATKMGESWGPWHGCSGWPREPGLCAMLRYCSTDATLQTVQRPRDRSAMLASSDFKKPLYWTQDNPKMIFVCPWSDFFSDDPTADKWRPLTWKFMRQTWWHTYRISTKYAEHIEDSLPKDWGPNGYENVWIGVSVENQDYAWRIDHLRNIHAKLKWVSAEPLLGPLDLTPYLKSVPLGWIISGGESGDSKHIPKS